jgi:pimeloyl-ACP methyl ester carboxylesterase
MRRVIAVAACVVLAACGSGGHARSTSSPAPSATNALAQWPCLAGTGATPLTVARTPALTAAALGSGSRAVVFVNESDQDLCSWLAYAKTLTGYRVVLYDYAGTPQGDVARVGGYLRAHGASAVGFVGASQGAKAAIIAAAASHPQAVVSLSAEAALQGTAVAPYAAELTAPALFVTATGDEYGAATATPGFEKAAPARAKRLVVVPGTAHGTALLAQPAIARDVTQFLARYDR